MATLHPLFMTATQATPPAAKMNGRWFFCAIVKESDALGISKLGTSCARRLADGRYEVHSAGKKVVVSCQDAALCFKAETARGEVFYLNSTERADVEMGRVWVRSN